MPVSVFTPSQLNSIDFLPWPPGSPVPDIFNLGLYYLGGAKALQRRPLIDWNVYGTALSGRALNAADVIQSAELLLYIQSITGGSGFSCSIERNTRTDWNKAVANWQDYKTATAWTTSGGDVDTSNPPTVLFTSPTTISYDMEIAGMIDFVEDAIASRGGIVRTRLRKTDEGVLTSYYFTADGTFNAYPPRLRVTYATAEPRPMMVQGDGTDRATRTAQPGQIAKPARGAQPARHARPAPGAMR